MTLMLTMMVYVIMLFPGDAATRLFHRMFIVHVCVSSPPFPLSETSVPPVLPHASELRARACVMAAAPPPASVSQFSRARGRYYLNSKLDLD